MPRVIVEVMPRRGAPDPQGKSITGVLPRVGFAEFTDVRQGKRFELSVEGPVTAEVLERARALAEEILANPVTEEITSVASAEGA